MDCQGSVVYREMLYYNLFKNNTYIHSNRHDLIRLDTHEVLYINTRDFKGILRCTAPFLGVTLAFFGWQKMAVKKCIKTHKLFLAEVCSACMLHTPALYPSCR